MSSWSPNTLCLEVFQMIIEELFVQDKLKLLQLNKQWNVFMEGNTQAWRHLDFGPLEIPWHAMISDMVEYDMAEYGMTESDIAESDMAESDTNNLLNIRSVALQYGARARYSVRQLRINNKRLCGGWEFLMTSNWQHLVDLELGVILGETGSLAHLAQNLPNLKRIDIGGRFAIDVAVLFLEHCLELQYANFRLGKLKPADLTCTGCISRKLKALLFTVVESWWCGYDEPPDPDFPPGLIKNAWDLEELSLSGYHWIITPSFMRLKSLKILSMPLVIGCRHLPLPPTIEELCVGVDGLKETSIITPLPSLAYLNVIYRNSARYKAGLNRLCKAIGSNLAMLHITLLWSPDKTDDDGEGIIRCFGDSSAVSNVKTLCFSNHSGPTASLMEAVKAGFPKLEIFVIKSERHVSKDIFRTFVERLPELQVFYTKVDEHIQKSSEEWLIYGVKDIDFQTYEKFDYKSKFGAA